jgi:hypothetical protein
MSKGEKRQIVPGLIMIGLGIIFLLSNFGAVELDWEVLWTWILIVMGVIFWLGFIFDRSKDGLIMPGTILLTIGIVFNISARFDWAMLDHLWPFFILAPAFGFYAMFLFGKRDRGILVPAVILTIVGTIFLMGSIPVLKYIWPLLLIGIGVLIITRPGGGAKPGGNNMKEGD